VIKLLFATARTPSFGAAAGTSQSWILSATRAWNLSCPHLAFPPLNTRNGAVSRSAPLADWPRWRPRPPRIQSRLPDALIRRLVGILVIAIGARYLWTGLN